LRCILNALEMARQLVNVLEEKKAENILLLDIHEIASFTDYFVICNGTSDRMLSALADAVSEAAHHIYQLPARIEGQPEDGWLLVDLGDTVVHLFSPDQRDYYRLEQLWEKGKILLKLQ
jgi:ribosome-associated protein